MIRHVTRGLLIGIDRAKMRLYDCEQSAQEDILDNGKNQQYDNEDKPKKSFDGV